MDADDACSFNISGFRIQSLESALDRAKPILSGNSQKV
jgi:hypothetical protein